MLNNICVLHLRHFKCVWLQKELMVECCMTATFQVQAGQPGKKVTWTSLVICVHVTVTSTTVYAIRQPCLGCLTGAQMVLTLKMISAAVCYHDGLKPAEVRHALHSSALLKLLRDMCQHIHIMLAQHDYISLQDHEHQAWYHNSLAMIHLHNAIVLNTHTASTHPCRRDLTLST